MKQIYDMLKLENIKILAGVKDWKEAIYTAVQPLVDGGYCEARYSDEIIKNTEKLGPYYVLCENVALIHGSTEQGVIKRQIAITLLKEPVKFKEDGYDATDAESHMEVLQAMSELFESKESTQRVLDASNEKEIYDLFVGAV